VKAREQQAPELPAKNRAYLARALLDNLDRLLSQELDRLCSQRRGVCQINVDAVEPLGAEDVDCKVRTLLL